MAFNIVHMTQTAFRGRFGQHSVACHL